MGNEDEKRPDLEQAIDTYMFLLPMMLKKHEGDWVVIKDGEKTPLGYSKSPSRILRKAFKTYGITPFLWRQVSREYLEYGRNGKPVIIDNENTPTFAFIRRSINPNFT